METQPPPHKKGGEHTALMIRPSSSKKTESYTSALHQNSRQPGQGRKVRPTVAHDTVGCFKLVNALGVYGRDSTTTEMTSCCKTRYRRTW